MEELAYFLIILGLMPLSFGGVYILVGAVVKRIKVRMGHIELFRITKNFRLKRQISKPDGGKLKMGGVPVPFNNKPPFIAFDGTTPVTLYTAEGKQINLTNPGKEQQIEPGYLSNLITEAYNLGIVSALKQDNIIKLFMIAAVIAAAVAAVFGFMSWQQVSQLPVSG